MVLAWLVLLLGGRSLEAAGAAVAAKADIAKLGGQVRRGSAAVRTQPHTVAHGQVPAQATGVCQQLGAAAWQDPVRAEGAQGKRGVVCRVGRCKAAGWASPCGSLASQARPLPGAGQRGGGGAGGHLPLSSELRATSMLRWLAEGIPSCAAEACGGSGPSSDDLPCIGTDALGGRPGL